MPSDRKALLDAVSTQIYDTNVIVKLQWVGVKILVI